MQAKKVNGIPAYKRIQAEIRIGIDAGQLRAGDGVPSESELARTYDVRLKTDRNDLASLEREALVGRRRDVCTFVAAAKIHFNKLMNYTEQMGSRGLTTISKVLFTKVIDNEEEATARLALPPRSRVFKLERLRHAAGGEPFALETCYLPADQFSGLQNAPLQKESLFSTLQRDYHVELSYSDEEVDATAADPRTAELLSLPKRAPLLRIRQVIYSTKGVVILYVLGLYRSDRHNLVIRRYR